MAAHVDAAQQVLHDADLAGRTPKVRPEHTLRILNPEPAKAQIGAKKGKGRTWAAAKTRHEARTKKGRGSLKVGGPDSEGRPLHPCRPRPRRDTRPRRSSRPPTRAAPSGSAASAASHSLGNSPARFANDSRKPVCTTSTPSPRPRPNHIEHQAAEVDQPLPPLLPLAFRFAVVLDAVVDPTHRASNSALGVTTILLGNDLACADFGCVAQQVLAGSP